MTDRPWLSAYPNGVPADIDPTQYASLVELMEASFGKFADRCAYSFLGKDTTFGQTDTQSRALAAYLQNKPLPWTTMLLRLGGIPEKIHC